jgi:hypothetical protein
MNLHAKTHELENLLLVKQLIHLRRELREPRAGHELHELSQI